MKIKGLRWWIIGLIMLITIINYLDRGTLNYMWIANIEYRVVDEIDTEAKENQAVYNAADDTYFLLSKRGEEITQIAEYITLEDAGKIAVNRQGMAYELGIIEEGSSPEDVNLQPNLDTMV